MSLSNQIRKKSLRKLVNGNSWFSVNRHIARKIGLNAAVFLSEVIDKYDHFSESGQLTEDGWFYLTIDQVEERTTLAKDAQRGCVRILQDLKIFQCKQMGMPSKRYFKIDEDALDGFIQNIFADRGNSDIKKEETRHQDRGNSDIKIAGIPTSGQGVAHIVKRKELTKENLLLHSRPSVPAVLDPPITKTEEEELAKRKRERPAGSSPIRNYKDWAKKVVESIRQEKEAIRLEEERKIKTQQDLENRIAQHKAEAEKENGKTYNGWTILAGTECVYFKGKDNTIVPLPYSLSDREWNDRTGELLTPNEGI